MDEVPPAALYPTHGFHCSHDHSERTRLPSRLRGPAWNRRREKLRSGSTPWNRGSRVLYRNLAERINIEGEGARSEIEMHCPMGVDARAGVQFAMPGLQKKGDAKELAILRVEDPARELPSLARRR